MSEDNALFRKAALDKLASPERLDVLMQVTSPQGWAALWTIAAILVGGLVWSIFGSFPERVDGQGLLISGGGLRQIRANGSGIITEISLSLQKVVKVGDIVGEVRASGVDENLKASQEKYEDAKRAAETAELDDRTSMNGYDLQILEDQAQLSDLRTQLNEARLRLDERQKSFDAGNITLSALQQAKDRVSSLTSSISTKNQSILSKQEQKRNINQKIQSRNAQVASLKSQTGVAVKTAAEVSQITATVAGKVIDVIKKQGDRVTSGEVVATIEPEGTDFEAIVFVSSEVGKRIKPDMEVQISPSTVKREEFGFMKGKVSRVGDYAVSAESANATLGNPELAKKFLAGGTKFELRVAPTPDPNTVSGFSWSSSAGPPLRITSGTEVKLSIVVDSHAPIAEVLPFLKKMLGAS